MRRHRLTLVTDDDRLGDAVFVVVYDEAGALLSQTHTTVVLL